MEEARRAAGLPGEEHVEVAVTIEIADRRTIAHVALHQPAHLIPGRIHVAVIATEGEARRRRDIHAADLGPALSGGRGGSRQLHADEHRDDESAEQAA